MDNNSQRPLVSICIPTIGRADKLKICIDSIICQNEFAEGLVEIVVSDNFSGDNTAQVCKQYADKYSNFIYFRNEQQYEDKNFPLCISRGNAVFRKIINDNVIFKPGSLALFCDIVDKYSESKPHIFILNKNERKLNENVDLDLFIFETSIDSTWIGSYCFWDSEIDDLQKEFEICSTRLWQLYKICDLFEKKNEGVLYFSNFCDTQPITYKIFPYNFEDVFYYRFFEMIQPFIDKNMISEKTKAKVEKDLLYKFFINWMIPWELKDPRYDYGPNNDLKEKIYSIYKDKSYFRRFKMYYRYKVMETKCKNSIKQKMKK